MICEREAVVGKREWRDRGDKSGGDREKRGERWGGAMRRGYGDERGGATLSPTIFFFFSISPPHEISFGL